MMNANEHEREIAFSVLEEYFDTDQSADKTAAEGIIWKTIEHKAQRERAFEKFRFLVEMKKWDLAHPPKKKFFFPWRISIERRK